MQTHAIAFSACASKGYGDFEEKLKLKAEGADASTPEQRSRVRRPPAPNLSEDVLNSDGSVDSDMEHMTVSSSAASTAMALFAVADSLRRVCSHLMHGLV